MSEGREGSARREQAVVLGASMAGLLAARQLADHFERVTVVERDELPTGPDGRKGVPQGAHAHGLLPSGYRVLDGYFPGMMAELQAAGAPMGDMGGDIAWFQYGGWKLREPVGLRGIFVSRPALESAVRARVKALPNVDFFEGYDGEQPVFDAGAGVSGLVVKGRAGGTESTLAADLTVDASGRGSQSAKWLERWGFEAPPTTSVRVNVGYATRVFERRSEDLGGAIGAIIAGTPPLERRFAAALAAEGDRWVVTLAGILGDYPPTEEAGWMEFARSLPTSDVFELASGRPVQGAIASYRFPANQRHHYERMKRFPEGYVVIGDAICSFNPVYGQGMSASALESVALGEALAAGARNGDRGLARRFFRRASKIADMPWTVATGEDLRYPEVEGERPRLHGLLNRYLERVHHAATRDVVVSRKFFDVAALLAPPPSLMAPGVMWRVFRSGAAPTSEAAPSLGGPTPLRGS
jgi:2-polyprenyl-6-methoxyphenol hydroxylase-like FAD-dependent oxidoreductase